MTSKNTDLGSFLTYKGKPLVREGNVLYYGDPTARYILMLQVTDSKSLDDLNVATKVTLSLMSTDPDEKLSDRIIKKTEKDGLFNALDVGMIWLDRALKKE